MTAVISTPKKTSEGERRGSDLGKDLKAGWLPEVIRLELMCEGCTRGHLLKGGHTEMRARGKACASK